MTLGKPILTLSPSAELPFSHVHCPGETEIILKAVTKHSPLFYPPYSLPQTLYHAESIAQAPKTDENGWVATLLKDITSDLGFLLRQLGFALAGSPWKANCYGGAPYSGNNHSI